jgi:hypothetical protein
MAKNAADESQVKEQAGKEKRARERELNDLSVLLSLAEGRRVFRRLLDFCTLGQSVFHASALISYRSGAQDVGHYWAKEILEANPGVGVTLIADTYRERKEANDE